MTSYLRSTLTRQEWLESMYRKSKSPSTLNNAKLALKMLDKFCHSKYDKKTDEVIAELKVSSEDAIYIFLNNLIGFMDSRGIGSRTIQNYFSNIKSYLRSQGIKTDQQDIKSLINFPKIIKERRKELTLDTIRKLLNNSLPRKRALYLTLLSSGMRLSEALSLRKADFDFSREPILVKIRAETTKTKEARETYISKEAKEALLPILAEKKDQELVFTKNQNVMYAKISEESYFQKLRRRCGFDERYSNKRNFTVNMHAFRAYFHTKTSLRHGVEYANALDGHTGYLEQYYRLSEEERARMYMELEPSLLVYSNDQDLKIRKDLEEKFEKKTQEVDQLTKLVLEIKQELEKVRKKQERYEKTRKIAS